MPKRLKYKYHRNNTMPEQNENYIFVFGSNLGGFHRKGAADVAFKYFGAEMYKGVGIMGSSYAIPTKDRFIRTLDLKEISRYVNMFKEYTFNRPDSKFWVTAIGCGLAGYKNHQIAPMFKDCNTNCSFPDVWSSYLN